MEKGLHMDVKKSAQIEEAFLKSQLTTIRAFLKREEEPTLKARDNARSQMSIISDLFSNII